MRGGDVVAQLVGGGTSGRRVLGLFAHPDDEVFCAGGAMAHCAAAGAATRVVSLTQGEAGQIRDAALATRQTLGAVRAGELAAAASALGLDEAVCLDLGDGTLDGQLDDLVDIVDAQLTDFDPDVVITFGLDGGYGHPDHIASSIAAAVALARRDHRARLLHAVFPMNDQLLLDVIVRWLRDQDARFTGSAGFGHALKLFADGSSMLGFAADHIDVEWFPAGSYIIEQGEPAWQLYCILSGEVDVVVESPDGTLDHQATPGAGCFLGDDGLATGQPRNAHVIARTDVTCLALSPQRPSASLGRGANGQLSDAPGHGGHVAGVGRTLPHDATSIDVGSMLGAKIAALAAHRSQYAMSLELFPPEMLGEMLGVEHFIAVDPAAVAAAAGRGPLVSEVTR